MGCLNSKDRLRDRVAKAGPGLRIDQMHRPILEVKPFGGGKTMWDIGCIGASVLFFAIAIGYAMGCDRLGTRETQR
jgi:hypothetical protein